MIGSDWNCRYYVTVYRFVVFDFNSKLCKFDHDRICILKGFMHNDKLNQMDLGKILKNAKKATLTHSHPLRAEIL